MLRNKIISLNSIFIVFQIKLFLERIDNEKIRFSLYGLSYLDNEYFLSVSFFLFLSLIYKKKNGGKIYTFVIQLNMLKHFKITDFVSLSKVIKWNFNRVMTIVQNKPNYPLHELFITHSLI